MLCLSSLKGRRHWAAVTVVWSVLQATGETSSVPFFWECEARNAKPASNHLISLILITPNHVQIRKHIFILLSELSEVDSGVHLTLWPEILKFDSQGVKGLGFIHWGVCSCRRPRGLLGITPSAYWTFEKWRTLSNTSWQASWDSTSPGNKLC